MPSNSPRGSRQSETIGHDSESNAPCFPTDDAILSAIHTAPMPVVNTRYLATQFDISSDRMADRLHRLREQEVVNSHEIAGRVRLWWL